MLALLLWKPFQYIMYKDEISYISIAERYARADWATAPNAYWAPLISWLLAIPLSTGLPIPIAVKLLSVLSGLMAYVSLQRLLTTFGVQGILRLGCSVVAIPSLVYFALAFFTPDLLLAAILTLYLSVVLEPHALHDLRRAGICGLLGALAYFCKGYALYFFAGHFGVAALASAIAARTSRERWLIARNGASGLAVATVLIAGWMALLYMKYGIVTQGVVGAYNYAIVGPDSPGRPTQYVGFVSPPATATVSVWEEPIYLYEGVKRWSPLESRRALMHQLGLLKDNWGITLGVYNSFSIFWAGIGLMAALFGAGPSGLPARRTIGLGIGALVLYPLGYSLVYSEQRYLWPMQMLLLCISAFVLHRIWRDDWLRVEGRRWIVAGLLTISFLGLPVVEVARRANDGQATHAVGEWFAQQGFRGARLASDADYGAAVCLAYRAGAKYYGTPGKLRMPAAELDRELLRHAIEYYLVWDGARVDSTVLHKYKEIATHGRRLTIYKVRGSAI